jgi:hypothetical protein
MPGLDFYEDNRQIFIKEYQEDLFKQKQELLTAGRI